MQQSVFDIPPDAPNSITSTIEDRFWYFHRENPHVYEALKSIAFDLKRVGFKKYGMKGLFEIVRWKTAIKTKNTEWKLNNNFTSMYARLLMQKEPELEGFFRTRRRWSE